MRNVLDISTFIFTFLWTFILPRLDLDMELLSHTAGTFKFYIFCQILSKNYYQTILHQQSMQIPVSLHQHWAYNIFRLSSSDGLKWSYLSILYFESAYSLKLIFNAQINIYGVFWTIHRHAPSNQKSKWPTHTAFLFQFSYHK